MKTYKPYLKRVLQDGVLRVEAIMVANEVDQGSGEYYHKDEVYHEIQMRDARIDELREQVKRLTEQLQKATSNNSELNGRQF